MSASGMSRMPWKAGEQGAPNSQFGKKLYQFDVYMLTGVHDDSSSGMSTTAAPKRKPAYDPARQWGLKPEQSEGARATYVFSGHVVNSSGSDSRSLFITENIGREGQAKAQTRMRMKDDDRELQRLLERDKEGMRAVIKAREAGLGGELGGNGKGQSKETGRKAGKTKGKDGKCAKSKKSSRGEIEANYKAERGGSYSTDLIRHLGFDPASKPDQRRLADSAVRKKVGCCLFCVDLRQSLL